MLLLLLKAVLCHSLSFPSLFRVTVSCKAVDYVLDFFYELGLNQNPSFQAAIKRL